MTITQIHSRPADEDEWTLTFDVRIRGQADPAVLDLIRDLRQAVDHVGRHGRYAADAADSPDPADVDPAAIRIDLLARSVAHGSRTIPLTRLEFELLLVLAEHPRRVFRREQLLHLVWDDKESGTRTVDVHIRRLRVKITDIPLITTVRGIGYRLADDATVVIVRR